MKLHFLCYSSIRAGDHENLLDEIANILTVARDFNSSHQITGVLYYSHGQFFQYIEGLESVIENLFDRIAVDPRHSFIHYYGTLPTEQRRFKNWSMKYVQGDSKIRELIEQHQKDHPLSSQQVNTNLIEFINKLTCIEHNNYE